MTNHVTDTNVGKMTEEEAVTHLETIINWNEDISVPEIEAVKLAIEALEFQQSLVRCGECKHYICDNPDSPDDAHIMICDLCSVGGYRVLAESDGYCSDGERRDDADVL